MYTCICGKTFENSQSFNGHKAHCKVHQVNKYGNLDKYYEAVQERSNNHRKSAECQRNKLIANKQSIWEAEQHHCEHCGKLMMFKFGSGRFCSKSCATARQLTNETKLKISKSLNEYNRQHTNSTYTQKYCLDCGKPLGHKNRSGYCAKHVMAHRVYSKEKLQQMSVDGKQRQIQGISPSWIARNNIPKEELFWINTLDTYNIPYKHEYVVHKADVGDSSHGVYRLDFLIDNIIDLEIDGKLHKLPERKIHDDIRDNYITNAGYVVYRIPTYTSYYKHNRDTVVDNFIKWYKTISECLDITGAEPVTSTNT